MGIYVSGGYQAQVFNNIAYGNAGGNFYNDIGDTIASHNLTDDPGFVDAGNRDFRLGSNSRAIDAGLSLADVTNDRLGASRPQGNGYDIGVYESGGSSGGGGSPPVTPSSSPSADGTTVPSALFIIDNSLSVWTIGSGQDIRRDGVHVGGGYGSQIRWSQGVIYVMGTDGNWWQWTGSAWAYFGNTAPGSGGQGGQGASPDGTRVSSGGSLVDNAQGTWTSALVKPSFETERTSAADTVRRSSGIRAVSMSLEQMETGGSGPAARGRSQVAIRRRGVARAAAPRQMERPTRLRPASSITHSRCGRSARRRRSCGTVSTPAPATAGTSSGIKAVSMSWAPITTGGSGVGALGTSRDSDPAPKRPGTGR